MNPVNSMQDLMLATASPALASYRAGFLYGNLHALMLHALGQNVRPEAIPFEDRLETRLVPADSGFRSTRAGDAELLRTWDLDETAIG